MTPTLLQLDENPTTASTGPSKKTSIVYCTCKTIFENFADHEVIPYEGPPVCSPIGPTHTGAQLRKTCTNPLRFSAQDGLITATQAESITTCEAWIQPYVKLYKISGMISFNKSAKTFGTTSTSHGNQRPRSSTGTPTADFKTLHPSGALACEGMRSGITGIPTTTNSDNILLTTSTNSDNILLATSEEMPESFYAHLTRDLTPKPKLVAFGLNNKSCRKKQTNNKPNYKLGNNGFAASRGRSGNRQLLSFSSKILQISDNSGEISGPLSLLHSNSMKRKQVTYGGNINKNQHCSPARHRLLGGRRNPTPSGLSVPYLGIALPKH